MELAGFAPDTQRIDGHIAGTQCGDGSRECDLVGEIDQDAGSLAQWLSRSDQECIGR